MKKRVGFWMLMAAAGVAAVAVVSGVDGVVELALAALSCEFVAAVARELRGDATRARRGVPQVLPLVALLGAAGVADALVGPGFLFRVSLCMASMGLSAFHRVLRPWGKRRAFVASPFTVAPRAPIMVARAALPSHHGRARMRPCMSSYRRGRGRMLSTALQR